MCFLNISIKTFLVKHNIDFLRANSHDKNQHWVLREFHTKKEYSLWNCFPFYKGTFLVSISYLVEFLSHIVPLLQMISIYWSLQFLNLFLCILLNYFQKRISSMKKWGAVLLLIGKHLSILFNNKNKLGDGI